GGWVSGGMGRSAANRSRTYQLMPPHRPDDASPMPNARRSNGPNVTVGPGGKLLGKCSPLVLGRKFGTAVDAMTLQRYAASMATPPAESAGLTIDPMAERKSAGILLYRRVGGPDGPVEVLLAHPGGPYF